MGTHRHKIGTFIRLTLADGSFGYGRLLEPPYAAFYRHQTLHPDLDLEAIASRPVLFKVAVSASALAGWAFIGCKALESHLAQPLVQFRQDLGDFRRCVIFDTAGHKRTAEPRECVGLERAAVWEQESIAERVFDTLHGRSNAAVEHLAVRLR